VIFPKNPRLPSFPFFFRYQMTLQKLNPRVAPFAGAIVVEEFKKNPRG